MIRFMIRFLITNHFIRVIDNGISDAGVLSKAWKGINKEYEGNESWENGKKEAFRTFIICFIGLIVISYIVC